MKSTELNKDQLELISKYFADISKILVASIVIGFFIQNSDGQITILGFFVGSITALVTFWISVYISK